MVTKRAVVTGASSGIGRASAAILRERGWEVVAVARRADRLAELEQETGAVAFAADLTSQTDIDALAAWLAETGPVHALVHVAGGARGTDVVAEGSVDDWQWMYDVNVLSAQRLVKTLLPQLRTAAASDGHADLMFVTSTAAHVAYQGGGGYNAAKAAEKMLVNALRLELNGEPLRVVEIAPGMVFTEEFSLNRLRGNSDAAASVYDGVENPLTARDVADVIAYAADAPGHVNLDLVMMRPVAQSAQHVLSRGPLHVRDEG
ncbi:NADP-dependent 3-hydroxy acid dehydrogenase YdfG [Microbacterium endophyticum]|uniref:NADP-dependent 3-hydroxy acid dehydrogenase YdfG n=1 Tax=Microbacterium endophyticum TaxID=1526412 RepID=A0A7W4V4B2_9MICO|nr:SDR family oxidoreductase [Microbacterium endophyticum]MBB2976279.1 NADP-dependent 3-hydroxy acid dehydrogenase YdfG [Microbacterium endophyticum]NIK35159.1 NADP-dependent 3-hydroxy acid dehydrogenase YdfG [Microbacterium endophyticum]